MQIIDYENAVVDLMLKDNEERVQISLFVDSERDSVSATRYMLRRMGGVIGATLNEEQRAEIVRRSDKLKNIHYSTPEFAASSLRKLRVGNTKPIAVYVRAFMSDHSTPGLLQSLQHADRLVFMSI